MTMILTMTKKSSDEVELHSDAWARFERAAEVVAKSPPEHRQSDKSRKKRSPKIKKGQSK
jgi:hypothetical protein